MGILGFLEIGRRIGIRRLRRDPEFAKARVSVVEGAVFGLLGLMIAFTFSGAASRFDARRHLIVEEANDIGTAWLRLELLPPADQPPLRDLFRTYLASRLELYKRLADPAAMNAQLDRIEKLQKEIWTKAVVAVKASGDTRTTSLLLGSLNEMIDITTDRTMALQTHPPIIIFAMLIFLAFAAALLAGVGMASPTGRNWVHELGFGLVLAAVVYVILDLEFPRFGLIRIDAVDQVLIDLLDSMK